MHTLQQLRNGALAGAVRLQLSCGLTEFPPEIFDLADTLEILDLSGNDLTTLPADLPRLAKLRIIFCSSNHFTVLPAVLGACKQLTMIGFKSNRIRAVPGAALPPSLRWLILTDNQITALPAEIGLCTQLQKLMLAGNELSDLPMELAACRKLELLRIAANRLVALPPWLLEMPRLAWLAYAGNPFSAADDAASTGDANPAGIAWKQLRLEQKLGEGASGVIHQAVLHERAPDPAADRQEQPATGARAVAVKLFKGAITSDGLPRCELAAWIGAGAHANLIPVLGEVRDHPDGVHACVMTLVEPGYRNLAGPPSLDSCTRDIYPDDKSFTPAALLRLAGGIASAAHHLHGRGILHGDLYAHNILHTGAGDALLGDFGAASRFAVDAAHAVALQRLEVRAFGLLLAELMARCDDGEASGDILTNLQTLQRACTQAVPAARPLFLEVARHITDTAQRVSRQDTSSRQNG